MAAASCRTWGITRSAAAFSAISRALYAAEILWSRCSANRRISMSTHPRCARFRAVPPTTAVTDRNQSRGAHSLSGTAPEIRQPGDLLGAALISPARNRRAPRLPGAAARSEVRPFSSRLHFASLRRKLKRCSWPASTRDRRRLSNAARESGCRRPRPESRHRQPQSKPAPSGRSWPRSARSLKNCNRRRPVLSP